MHDKTILSRALLMDFTRPQPGTGVGAAAGGPDVESNLPSKLPGTHPLNWFPLRTGY